MVEDMPSETEEIDEISMKIKAGSREGENDEVVLPDPNKSTKELLPKWVKVTARSGRQLGRKDDQYNPSSGNSLVYNHINRRGAMSK